MSLRPADGGAPPPEEAEDEAAAPPPAARAPAPPPAAAPPPPLLERPPEPAPLNVVGAGPDDPHEPGMVPHPMDEAHARIHDENRLIQRLNDAMSFHDVKLMRTLLVEYRKLDPNDIDASQAGYAIIADCIEFPGEASLARAHEFYDTQRHSPLRRYMRRICFEGSN